jgi:ribosome-binding factor A
MKNNDIKHRRINEEVAHELSILISREVSDPRINPMTSVTAAHVATDLKTAKVFVSIMADEEAVKETLTGLKSAAPFLRSMLAKRLNLRNTPQLAFERDTTMQYGAHMSQLIDEVIAADDTARSLRIDTEADA